MKIGFSFGRCVRDIVNGHIDINDVAFIIASTAIRNEDAVNEVIQEYMYTRGYLRGLNFDKCKDTALALWRSDRIIQPRLQGMHRHFVPENAIWADLFPTVLSNKENVKNAWNAYRCMLHMVEKVDGSIEESLALPRY